MQKNLYFTGKNAAQKLRSWEGALEETRKHWKTLDRKNSALIVIDMQEYFLGSTSHAFVPTAAAITPNIQKLVQAYRKDNLPVIFTYFAVEKGEADPIGNWWGRSVVEGSKECKIVDQLAPKDGETVLRKSSYNSFSGTDLKKILESQNISQLVVTGVLSNLCCETTAREAFNLGMDVFFVMDATAAFTEQMHLASLLNLSCGFATPITADQLLHFSSVS
ncbi:MAG: isochorismatase family cysteine hydrolase [Candidatus Peribacteraceae bacterium]|jgi:isochorismate hydrolase|nr:hypothetical protein [bacterium]MDP6561730.1 isochorismatase family cysteine hydrolase [Candidatus Peribacteraceae bacterium]|tara:strand:+ start:3112 stop:3771 length:660 start_codon:yes stop_codon:yes gene_type:complete